MRRLPLVSLTATLSLLSLALLGAGVRSTLEPPRPVGGVPGGGGEDEIDLEGLPAATGLRFGIDAPSSERFAERTGTPPDYATVWVGRWTLHHGWRETDQALRGLRSAGVTPAIHFWYWGDDLRPDCFTVGCNGKSVADWDQLHTQTVEHVRATMGDAPVLVILESEFNKHGLHASDDLDARLADKARAFKQHLPNAQVVLGFGNWASSAWGTFDQAAAASDLVGVQALAGSTRDPEHEHLELVDHTLNAVRHLQELFGKPLVVTDVAVSSYPEPDHLEVQQEALARFAMRMPELQEAGVQAVIYRSFLDVPDMALANHYAEAERHWGLAWHGSGELKPGGEAWLAAVMKARAPPAQAALDKVVGGPT